MKIEESKVKKSFTIHDLPASERPRERLQKFGAEALSAQEILAVILGRGISGESVMVTAQRLLSQFGSLKGIASASLEELSGVRGIGLAKAAQIRAVFELTSRLEDYHDSEKREVVKTPEDVVAQVRSRLKSKKKEYFLALLLDTRSQLIRIAEISVGSLDSSIVHPREVFKEAISASAASVIFAHNHPSGDPEPSAEDISITQQLVFACKTMGITVHEHLVIGNNNYFSFADQGYIARMNREFEAINKGK